MQSEPLKQRLCLAPNKSFLQVPKEFDSVWLLCHETFPCVGVQAQGPASPRGIPGSSIHWQEKPKFPPGILHQSQQGFAPAPSEGWGAQSEAAASASQGNRAAPAPQCWLQTSHDPALANCGFIPKQNKSALPKVPHNQRLYSNKMVFFPIAALRAQDQPRNLLQKHGQVKHCLKLKILPLASPPWNGILPFPPLLL